MPLDGVERSGTTGTDRPAPGGRLAVVALIAAHAVSLGGTAMTMLAIPWFVLATTGSPADTGLVSAAETAGLVVSAALGGPLIDRLGARRTSIGADLSAAAVVAAIPTLHYTVGLPVWLLAALAAALGLTRAPGAGSRYALLPAVVNRSRIPMERATSGYEAAGRAMRMVGGSTAGAMILLSGPPTVLYLDAASFLVCALIVWFAVPAPTVEPSAHRSWWRRYVADLREGLRYLRRDRLVSGFVALTTVTNGLDSGYVAVFLPVYTREVLHGNTFALGLMVSGFSVGALVGSMLYGWLGPVLPRWRTFAVCVLTVGAPRFAVLLLHPHPPIAVLVVVSVVCGTSFGALNPIMSTIEYARIPAALRGRVLSTAAAGAMLGLPIGAALAGLALETLSLTAAIATFAAVYLAVALVPLVFRSWREMDAKPTRPDDAAAKGND